jgi:hypothetical protein
MHILFIFPTNRECHTFFLSFFLENLSFVHLGTLEHGIAAFFLL